MAPISENLINLKTLQRVDSSILEIIDTACQVAIYKYDRKLEKWEGTDVEGTLFLYRRSLYPQHGFIIVNRMSTTNFIESITSEMQFQLKVPYLLYKNSAGDIIGSWFYEEKDLQRISKQIQKIILKQNSALKRQRCASESETLPESTGTSSQDILTLLSEAQKEYIKKSNDPHHHKNSCGNSNNLNTSSEKKLIEKSLCSLRKEKSGKGCSFSENYPISPRRRYVSTGSFDLDRTNSLAHMFSSMHAKIDEVGTEAKPTESEEKDTHEKLSADLKFKDAANSLTSAQLSSPMEHPSFASSCDKSPSIYDLIVNKFTDAYNMNTHSSSVKNSMPCSQSFDSQKWQNIISDNSNIQLTSIKEAMKCYMEDDSKVIVKIHEAYVSSLKTLFS